MEQQYCEKKESFQFCFKSWKSWALPDVLPELIPNIHSKVSETESVKALSLAFASLDFEHVGIWKRAKHVRWSVDTKEFREVSRTRSIDSMEAHACNFAFNALWNGKPVQLFQERCRVVMTRCHEDGSCSKVLNFLERLDDRSPWGDSYNTVTVTTQMCGRVTLSKFRRLYLRSKPASGTAETWQTCMYLERGVCRLAGSNVFVLPVHFDFDGPEALLSVRRDVCVLCCLVHQRVCPRQLFLVPQRHQWNHRFADVWSFFWIRIIKDKYFQMLKRRKERNKV